MKPSWSVLTTQMCCAISAMFVWLAHQYETVGLGLNPWIALPVATLFIIIAYPISELVEPVLTPEEEAILDSVYQCREQLPVEE